MRTHIFERGKMVNRPAHRFHFVIQLTSGGVMIHKIELPVSAINLSVKIQDGALHATSIETANILKYPMHII